MDACFQLWKSSSYHSRNLTCCLLQAKLGLNWVSIKWANGPGLVCKSRGGGQRQGGTICPGVLLKKMASWSTMLQGHCYFLYCGYLFFDCLALSGTMTLFGVSGLASRSLNSPPSSCLPSQAPPLSLVKYLSLDLVNAPNQDFFYHL